MTEREALEALNKLQYQSDSGGIASNMGDNRITVSSDALRAVLAMAHVGLYPLVKAAREAKAAH